jgi:hypothetical protein
VFAYGNELGLSRRIRHVLAAARLLPFPSCPKNTIGVETAPLLHFTGLVFVGTPVVAIQGLITIEAVR